MAQFGIELSHVYIWWKYLWPIGKPGNHIDVIGATHVFVYIQGATFFLGIMLNPVGMKMLKRKENISFNKFISDSESILVQTNTGSGPPIPEL